MQDKRSGLAPRPGTRLRMLASRLSHGLRMSSWFPHIPLMLGVMLLGVLQLMPSLRGIDLAAPLSPQLFAAFDKGFASLSGSGVPMGLMGLLLLVMSVGLVARSRLAWVLISMLVLGTMLLQLLPGNVDGKGHWGFEAGLLLALLLSRGQFRRTSLATATLFAVVGILLALGYGVLGAYALGSQFKPPINDFGTAIYFAVVTMSTVGFGDIVPKTPEARWFTLSLIVFGLAVFATSLTAIIGPMMNQRLMNFLQPGKKHMKRKDHIIVVGDNSLARNTIKALVARGMPVTVIWKHRPPEGADAPEDLLIGDAADADLLRTAEVDKARAVLALSEDDSDNAFVVLAAKEVNEKVRTVVTVSDVHNLMRVRRVHPDIVLALPVLGGELLAMAISGEEIRADALIDQLFTLD